MATIKEVKENIKNANALGRQNLTEKGVTIPENATTYEIMTAIAEISDSGGGGVTYSSIIYNEDDTITLTDKEGVEHTMSCTYEDGKLIGVTYDGKKVNLTYDGDVLVKVGKTAVDMVNAPKEPKTTVKADSSASNLVLVDVSSEVVITSREITTNSSVV